MPNPPVVCVMLTASRPELTKRAIRSFNTQHYKNRALYVLDNGAHPCCSPGSTGKIFIEHDADSDGLPLYELMNLAAERALRIFPAPLIAKWDSDDWSHPKRLEEQVARMQSGLAVTGYNALPFIQEPHYGDIMQVWEYWHPSATYAVGSSFMFTRDAWETQPFPDSRRPDAPVGKRNEGGSGGDSMFCLYWGAKGRVLAVDSTGEDGEPRLIASIHGGNTTVRNIDERFRLASKERRSLVLSLMENA